MSVSGINGGGGDAGGALLCANATGLEAQVKIVKAAAAIERSTG
jgi:hypothetical protein